jgi:hypothetical protein
VLWGEALFCETAERGHSGGLWYEKVYISCVIETTTFFYNALNLSF